jgi:hypothetical protein
MKGFCLRVIGGPDQGLVVSVSDPDTAPVQIGRSKAQDPARDLFCAKDVKVSRRHATIEAVESGFVLRDHGSTNGTRLKGQKLEPGVPAEVRDGDEIRIGPDTVVRFEVQDDADATRITSVPPGAPEPRRPAAAPAAPPLRRAPAPDRPRAPEPKTSPVSTARKSPSTLAEEPRERFGPFAVYRSLSRDETDSVDVAVDTRSGTRVALKRFESRLLSRGARKRLAESAARAQRWNHPNIATVLDTGEREGKFYVASRFVEGESLAEIHGRFARDIDAPLATYIARETCRALDYGMGEEPGFVHRNITPHTILVSGGGQVVLINFGFVQIRALLDTTVRLTAADARYLSPEHRTGRGLDPRSDVFSTGIVLYELLAQELIDPRRTAVLPEVDAVRPEVPPELADITTRAIALRPSERFASPGEMGEELAEVLDRLAPGYGPEAREWMAAHFPDLSAAPD